VVVVLANSHPAIDADWLAVLLPRRPRRRVAGHAAQEPNRLADVGDPVVKYGVKFRRTASLQPFGTSVVRFACKYLQFTDGIETLNVPIVIFTRFKQRRLTLYRFSIVKCKTEI